MNAIIQRLGRRLRLGVVGGGPGSFIGPVHRTAARRDARFEVVAGVLSSDPERSRAAGQAIGLAADRAYGDWRELLAVERVRDDGIDAVAVMTPNAGHYPVADAALDAGFDVICDKPLTTTLADALKLVDKVRSSGLVFCLTHNYSAYPMVRQARAMVKAGELGEIRQVQLEYIQGHLARRVEDEATGPGWRFDAELGGGSLVLGDIGTHAHHLGAFVTGLDVVQVMADVGSNLPGRRVDDYAALLLRFANGARGSMWVTNAAAGAEHGLAFRAFGDQGGLEWHQEQPNHLLHRRLGDFPRLMTRRLDGLMGAEAEHASRVGIGHPEGYQEAFATLYADAADAIAARLTGQPCDPLALDFPTALDGAKGIKLIDAALESRRTGTWADCRLEV
ncbi:MAG: Gfo/Idh/MocA family oxidoreductase [Inquilinus sp.]|nr:Gfo/Idh/MocA family oxidoreductase [Inquilinus sp.]